MNTKALMGLCLALATLALGCEAAFTDLRPEDTGPGLTTDPLLDPLANNDSTNNSTADMGTGQTTDEDTPADMPDVPATEEVILSGNFVRVGYEARGSAEIVRLPDDTYEVRLGEDFFNGRIPGPVLVLSLESSIGSSIDPQRGDIEIAALTELSGAQTFKLPFAPGPRRHLWVYCKPFGLESSLALLSEPGEQ